MATSWFSGNENVFKDHDLHMFDPKLINEVVGRGSGWKNKLYYLN